MAITFLEDEALERSTYPIPYSFTDYDGGEVIPNSVLWTLTDGNGTVINGLEQESVTPAASITTVLSGDDLQILESEASEESVLRYFTVEAVYDSDLGDGLPLKGECAFRLRNLKYVS